MVRSIILYGVSAGYIVLAIWAIVEAFFLKIHWAYKIGLSLLSLVITPLGFAVTYFVKDRTTKKKKKGQPKNKQVKKKKEIDSPEMEPSSSRST